MLLIIFLWLYIDSFAIYKIRFDPILNHFLKKIRNEAVNQGSFDGQVGQNFINPCGGGFLMWRYQIFFEIFVSQNFRFCRNAPYSEMIVIERIEIESLRFWGVSKFANPYEVTQNLTSFLASNKNGFRRFLVLFVSYQWL